MLIGLISFFAIIRKRSSSCLCIFTWTECGSAYPYDATHLITDKIEILMWYLVSIPLENIFESKHKGFFKKIHSSTTPVPNSDIATPVLEIVCCTVLSCKYSPDL